MKRNLLTSIIIALILALIGVALWGAVSYVFDLRLGLVGILIGFMVGKALSKSNDYENITTGAIAVVITIATIILGEYLSLVLVIMKTYDLSPIETLKNLDVNGGWQFIVESSGVKSLIIYIISLVQAYKIGASVGFHGNTEEAPDNLPNII